MPQYVTEAELLAVLPDATSEDTTALASLRTRASAVVDRYLGRTFEAAGSPAARTFYGTGTHLLRIDWHEDALVTSVTLPDGWTAPSFVERRDSGSELCYLNTTDSSGRLYTNSSRMPGGYADDWFSGFSLAVWPEGLPVTISAAWGYATYPGDIQDATVEICQSAWRETYTSSLDAWLGQVGLEFAIPPRAKDILSVRRAAQNFEVTG